VPTRASSLAAIKALQAINSYVAVYTAPRFPAVVETATVALLLLCVVAWVSGRMQISLLLLSGSKGAAAGTVYAEVAVNSPVGCNRAAVAINSILLLPLSIVKIFVIMKKLKQYGKKVKQNITLKSRQQHNIGVGLNFFLFCRKKQADRQFAANYLEFAQLIFWSKLGVFAPENYFGQINSETEQINFAPFSV
jgi:hypothetical protein